MQRAFEEVAWTTPVGEVSAAFNSESGTHILFRTE
jgi:parvulin-like peptidyl-prolyl isomerase